jgi:hypothetical protein
MGASLNILSWVSRQGCSLGRVRAQGKPSPIPIFPGDSQGHSHLELKLGNQMTSTSKVRPVDFGDCGPPNTTESDRSG